MNPIERLLADISASENIVEIVDAVLRNDTIATLLPREREQVSERIVDAVKEWSKYHD